MGGMDYVEHTICECRERVLQGGEETGILHLVSMFVSLFILFARLARLDDASLLPLLLFCFPFLYSSPWQQFKRELFMQFVCVCVAEARNV